MKKLAFILVALVVLTAGNPIKDCCFTTRNGKQIPLHGRVEFVQSNADFSIEIVESFADFKVQFVTSSHNNRECGAWEIVQSNADFRVEIVPSNADFRVQYVSNFPGVDWSNH